MPAVRSARCGTVRRRGLGGRTAGATVHTCEPVAVEGLRCTTGCWCDAVRFALGVLYAFGYGVGNQSR